MRQMAEVLAGTGWAARGLCTSGCEGPMDEDTAALLAARGVATSPVPAMAQPALRVLAAESNGVRHDIVCVDPARKHHWEQDAGAEYHARLGQLVRDFRPDVALTFGGDPGDARRRESLRTAGTRVVFALHNLAYLRHRPAHVDAFLAPTEFVARRYREAWNAPVSVLPTPLVPKGIVSERHEPVFTTFVNPEPAKGLWLVARLAEMLGEHRPDIPLLVVEGRAAASSLVAAGHAGGTDLTRHANLMFSRAVPDVAALWSTCRLILAPSVVEEAAGRAVLEAMANGAVPLVSDRGALPETVSDAGIVLPLPSEMTAESCSPVAREAARPWFDAIQSLADDEPRYAAASAAARDRASKFLQAYVAPVYAAWFGSLL